MSCEVVFQSFSGRLCGVSFIRGRGLLYVLYIVYISFRFDLGLSEMRGRRRSRTEVVADILSEALGGVNKTRLMYRCNLNFVRFSRYLQELLDAGLVECVTTNPGGVTLYKTTDEGRELLKVLRRASEFLSI